MSNMVFFSAFLFAAIALGIAIPIFTGIYVYRDATRRGMEAWLWTAVAILVPSFIGLIIYLLCRRGEAVRCPKCDNPVAHDYMLCPFCGQHLKEICVGCGEPVEGGWRNCPHCGRKLGESSGTSAAPIRHKDRALVWIIAVIVAIPLVFLLAAVMLFRFSG